MARRRLEPWVALFAATICSICLQASGRVSISDGTSFVQAVTALLGTGNSETLDLIANISLQNVTFNISSANVDRGTLTIQSSAPDNQIVVLDTANKADLTPEFNPSAQLVLTGIRLTNMCIRELPWAAGTPPLQWASALQIHLFNRSRRYQSHTYNNLVLYSRPADIAHQLYSTYMTHYMPFTDTVVVDRKNAFLGFRGASSASIVGMSAYGMSYGVLWFENQVNMTNVTMKMVTDPGDALMRDMAASGQLQPYHWCNGTLYSPEPDNINIAPMIFAGDSPSLSSALNNATAYLQSAREQKFTPAIFLAGDATINPAANSYFALAGDVIVFGPLMNAPGTQGVTLDFANRKGTVHLPAGASIFFQNLTLSGLVLSLTDEKALTTALQLWAISPSDHNTPHSYLNNVTLVLPVSDYLGLYSAASLLSTGWSGCPGSKPDTAPAYGLQSSLFKDVAVFKLAAGTPPTIDAIVLDSYSGWGVKGTKVRLVPASSLAGVTMPAGYQPCGAAAPSGDDGNGNKNVALGVGVGVGVGGGLLAAALIVLWMTHRRHEAYRAEKASDAASENYKSTSMPGSLAPGQHQTINMMESTHMSTPTQGISAYNSRDSRNGGIAPTDVHPASTPAIGATAAATAAAGVSANVVAGSPAQAARNSNTRAAHGMVARESSTASERLARVKASTQGNLSTSGNSGNFSVLVDPAKAVREVANQLQRPEADKLVLSSVLGRGTWGVVYRGTWRNLPVAVKTLILSDSQGATQLQRAITEAAVCASVNHRNLVATYHYEFKPLKTAEALEQGLPPVEATGSRGVGTSDSGVSSNTGPIVQDYKLYLVQELCSSTLAQCMRAHVVHDEVTGEPDLSLVLQLLLDLAMGLEHLHSKNIMHGDLKPANVMLKTDASAAIKVVAKLTDFGLAATMDPNATHISNYNSGTPFYVAPEVASSHKASRASDIFSFGVMMWELHGGQPPWVRVPDRDGTGRTSYASNPAFPGWRRDAPRRFINLAMRCLNADPKARPQVGEVVAELTSMLQALAAGYGDLYVYPPTVPVGPVLPVQPPAPAPPPAQAAKPPPMPAAAALAPPAAASATPAPPAAAESAQDSEPGTDGLPIADLPEQGQHQRQLSAGTSGNLEYGSVSSSANAQPATRSTPRSLSSTVDRLKKLVTGDEQSLSSLQQDSDSRAGGGGVQGL